MSTLQGQIERLSGEGFCLVEVRDGLQVVRKSFVVEGGHSWPQYRGMSDLFEIPSEVLLMIHPQVSALTKDRADRIIENSKTGGWIGQWLYRVEYGD